MARRSSSRHLTFASLVASVVLYGTLIDGFSLRLVTPKLARPSEVSHSKLWVQSLDDDTKVQEPESPTNATQAATPCCDEDAPCLYIESTPFTDGSKPENLVLLGWNNFVRQGSSILVEALAEVGITSKNYIPPSQMPPECFGLTLDDQAVRDAERHREEIQGDKVETNPISRFLYQVGCFALDEWFPNRPIARFWFLETIARVPYFSYVSMLHLYESFGWWREPELRKVHYAEEYNELHHLLIMETLGGNARWRDRFLGYHVAVAYYWAVCALFALSPMAAYEFMELLEAHAVDTYTTFFRENKERLKSLPAPAVAVSYYKAANLYMFDDFQVSNKDKKRRPPCDNLYDVFKNICDDEGEHVRTMRACKDYARDGGDVVVSPHWVPRNSANSKTNAGEDEFVVSDEQRQAWLEWAQQINQDAATDSVKATKDTD